MTTYRIPDGHEYPEYTKFARYQGGVMFVPLLIGENRVRFYALCNLREVREPFMTDLYYTCEPPPAPVQGCALPPYMLDQITALTEILNTRPQERQVSRDLYVYELGYQIADALEVEAA